jgi:hypothetical protein
LDRNEWKEKKICSSCSGGVSESLPGTRGSPHEEEEGQDQKRSESSVYSVLSLTHSYGCLQLRKEAREEKKKKHTKPPSTKKIEQRLSVPTPAPKRPVSSSEMKPKKKKKIETTPLAASADPEDEEIERLERLLGVAGKGLRAVLCPLTASQRMHRIQKKSSREVE